MSRVDADVVALEDSNTALSAGPSQMGGSSLQAASTMQQGGSSLQTASTMQQVNSSLQTSSTMQQGGYVQQQGQALPTQQLSSPGQFGYMGQQGYSGQQGYMGQPGLPGQQLAHNGMPGQNGPIGPQDLAPQFNFQTIIRFIMEMTAIIQGCSLIGTMAGGWAREMGSNEEQPVRKVAVWIGSTIRSSIGSMLPFLGKRRQRLDLESAWAMESKPPVRPTRWWVVIGSIYFSAAILSEFNAYRRIRANAVTAAPESVNRLRACDSANAGRPTQDRSHSSVLQAGTMGSSSLAVQQRLPAEGDAAGGKSSLPEFYLEKHRERTTRQA